MMKTLESWFVAFSNAAWGTPLLVLLLGGGIFFLLYSRFLPYRYVRHAIDVLRGKYDDPNDPGDIDHYQALSAAIAATVGMGNISGVAVAIATGGPGALFWMWVSAMIGCATKFFTCTLSVMYRGKDTNGHIEGGPMYVIVEGLGKKWKPLAVMFCIAGLIGALPVFQANQLTQIIREVVLDEVGFSFGDRFVTDLMIGTIIMLIVSAVIFGGIHRISEVAGRLVPAMIALYVGFVMFVIIANISEVPSALMLVITDAFSGKAVLGGSVGAIIVAGARRAAFSNEAGIGTAPMMHGAAKTNEPVREGLVAMLGPFIDTVIVCTMTALAILITGVWKTSDADGITLTATAFEHSASWVGQLVLVISVFIFSFTTLFSFSYYGTKCTSFLFGAKYKHYYNYFYALFIIGGAVFPLKAVISLIDGMYAMMAIPTMVSALLLAPKVMQAASEYFKKIEEKS